MLASHIKHSDCCEIISAIRSSHTLQSHVKILTWLKRESMFYLYTIEATQRKATDGLCMAGCCPRMCLMLDGTMCMCVSYLAQNRVHTLDIQTHVPYVINDYLCVCCARSHFAHSPRETPWVTLVFISLAIHLLHTYCVYREAIA